MQDDNTVSPCELINVVRTLNRPSGSTSGPLRACERWELLPLAIVAGLLISFVAAAAHFRSEDAGRTGIKAFGAHVLDNALDDLRTRYRFESVRRVNW